MKKNLIEKYIWCTNKINDNFENNLELILIFTLNDFH